MRGENPRCVDLVLYVATFFGGQFDGKMRGFLGVIDIAGYEDSGWSIDRGTSLS